MEPNVYFVTYNKNHGKKLIEDPLHLHFVVDARKDEQGASVRQISLPFDNDPKEMELQIKNPYCFTYLIDIGEVWVFRIEYHNEDMEIVYVALHYIGKETHELIHTEELSDHGTLLSSNYTTSRFPPFYNVDIEKKKEDYKDFFLHITTLIVPFSLR